MDTALWIIQVILAIKLFTAAVTHGPGRDRQAMQEAVQKGGALSRALLSAAAAGCLAGAVGLVIPAVFGTAGGIIPYLAAGLAVMFLVSMGLHYCWRKDPKLFASAILAVLAACLAYGRWLLAPL